MLSAPAQTQQQYAVREVPAEMLPGQQWALVRIESATYLFLREGEVTPDVLEEAWAAFRWLALNRPAEHPNMPLVIPSQTTSGDLRAAVLRGHAGTV